MFTKKGFYTICGAFGTDTLPTDCDAARHRLRAHDDDAGHAVCLEEPAQFLFDDESLAARRVTHENLLAIAHDDSSMKHVEMLAGRHKKNQVSGLQMSFELRQSRLRHTFHASPLRSEAGYNIQNAFNPDGRYSRHRNRPDYPCAHVVANPERHVVIAAFPSNAALFVPNLAKPLGEVINDRRAGERHNCFDVGDTVESVEGSREHFGRVGRANQRIWFVGVSKEVARDKFDS